MKIIRRINNEKIIFRYISILIYLLSLYSDKYFVNIIFEDPIIPAINPRKLYIDTYAP